MSIESRLGEEQYCYLTTIGRVSGQPREIEIWFGARGDTIYMLSGGGMNAHWVMNILKNPHVSVRIDEETFSGTARLVEIGTPEESDARTLLATKYQGWHEGLPRSGWANTALPVAVELAPAGE